MNKKELKQKLKELKVSLMKIQIEAKGFGFNPNKRTPTKLIRDTKRQITIIKIMISKK